MYICVYLYICVYVYIYIYMPFFYVVPTRSGLRILSTLPPSPGTPQGIPKTRRNPRDPKATIGLGSRV